MTRMVTRLGLGGNGRLLWVEVGSPEDLEVAAAALSASYDRVLAKLRRNRPRLDALVGELTTHQELRGDEVRKILRRRPPKSVIPKAEDRSQPKASATGKRERGAA